MRAEGGYEDLPIKKNHKFLYIELQSYLFIVLLDKNINYYSLCVSFLPEDEKKKKGVTYGKERTRKLMRKKD